MENDPLLRSDDILNSTNFSLSTVGTGIKHFHSATPNKLVPVKRVAVNIGNCSCQIIILGPPVPPPDPAPHTPKQLCPCDVHPLAVAEEKGCRDAGNSLAGTLSGLYLTPPALSWGLNWGGGGWWCLAC